MPGPPALPKVREILSRRSGEEMQLNDRFLNPQMGRILRTLGFDKVWRGGEGAHLIDEEGERYLDMFGGYGVFAIGRNHPEAISALEEVMAARTGNLPQLGVTLLGGVLAEQLLARAPASVGAMVPANSGTEAVEAAIKIARAATGRHRVLYAEHAFHGLTLGALVAFIQYSERFWRPISDLSEKFNILQQAMASSERIFTLNGYTKRPVVAPKR